MKRRLLLKEMGAVALLGSFPAVLSQFISSCSNPVEKLTAGFFSPAEFDIIEQLAETLLPATSTPGALQAQVPYFIDLVVKDCMNKKDQDLIKDGLRRLNEEAGGKFAVLSKDKKLAFVTKTDEAAFKDDPAKAWFRMIKKLSLIGYFTSKEGMTAALNYVKVPGDYKACIPYRKGDKAQAKTFLMY